jgi:hypothetical protein
MSGDDPLLDRILYDCRLSAGTMPICIVVKDGAEKARGVALLKSRRNNRTIIFATEADLERSHQSALAAVRRHGTMKGNIR